MEANRASVKEGSSVGKLFYFFSVILFLIIAIAAAGLRVEPYIGPLFFKAFHMAAFYLPLYLAAMGYLLSSGKANASFISILNCTFFPFITLALAIKTAVALTPSPLEKALVSIFPVPGAPLILTGLFVLEVAVLVRHALTLTRQYREGMENHSAAPSAREREREIDSREEFNFSEALPTNAHAKIAHVDVRPRAAMASASATHSGVEDENFSFLGEPIEGREPAAFTKEESKPHAPPVRPHAESLNIESSFVNRKNSMESGFGSTALDGDPGLDSLNDPFYDSASFKKNLFTAEEEAALRDVATDIAESSEEESRIAGVIDSADKKLTDVLASDSPSYYMPRASQAVVDKKPYRAFSDDKEELPARENPFAKKLEQLKLLAAPIKESVTVSASNFFDEDFSAESDVDDDVSSEMLFDIPALPSPVESRPALPAPVVDSPVVTVTAPGGLYFVPKTGLLDAYADEAYREVDDETHAAARILEATLKEFNIEAKVINIRKGPVITMFELLPAAGVKLSRIEALADNIAFRLAASRVRIVAPIPGKQAVGIEAPNKKRFLVSFADLMADVRMESVENAVPIALGKDISGENQIVDLTQTPHLLIAGSTGSGKSVCVNSIICSILYTRGPAEVRMILIDPKVVELKPYDEIPHLLTPVITDTKKALQAIQWALYEMERRYALLDGMGVRNIRGYNKKIKERAIAAEHMPYIVLIIDEFADLMAVSGKELEAGLARLAAKSRAAGIHLILATQRPSADVITGLIKANFPSRIAFMVAGKTDSRIILDSNGAEQLLGRGDMLFVSGWNPFPTRIQGAYLSEEEVERVAAYVKTLGKPDYIDDEIFYDEDEPESFDRDLDGLGDPLFEKALNIVMETRKASASYLQRRLKIGYNRAARLVEEMESRGIVGPANGSKPRDLLRTPE